MNLIKLEGLREKAKPELPAWLDQCIAGDTGKPLAVLANVLLALRSAMPGAFAYDEMLSIPMLMHSLVDEDGFGIFMVERNHGVVPVLRSRTT